MSEDLTVKPLINLITKLGVKLRSYRAKHKTLQPLNCKPSDSVHIKAQRIGELQRMC